MVFASASDSLEVLLQFGFLAVLYLFLLWIVRSALRDLRRPATAPLDELDPFPGDDEPSGSRRAWLVVKGGAGLDVGDAYEIDRDLVIGRSADCAIQIGDTYASGRHLRMSKRGRSVFLEDLGSTNGTFLNGDRVNGEVELRGEDVIRIGDTEFRLDEE